jgi:hypothetical protein
MAGFLTTPIPLLGWSESQPDRSPQELVQIKEKMEEHWAHKNAINLRIAEIL